MEKLNEIKTQDINKLLTIIERFYDIEHFSEDWTMFKFGNKPNIDRLSFLLETIIVYNTDTSLQDKKDLINIFDTNLIEYLYEFLNLESYLNDNIEFRIFLQDFFEKIDVVKKDIEKWDMLMKIKRNLKSNLEHVDIFKQNFGENGDMKILRRFWTSRQPIFLIKSKNWELFFVDMINAKIIFECWNVFEKWYSFGENKLFVFQKELDFDFDIFKQEAKEFDIKNNDVKIWDFLELLEEKYNVKKIVDIKSRFKERDKFVEQDLNAVFVNENIFKALFFIVNNLCFKEIKKQIFVNNKFGNIIDLGLYDDVWIPWKIKNWYKDKEAIQISITQWDIEKILITNGIDYDIFDIQ